MPIQKYVRCVEYMDARSYERREIITKDPNWQESDEATEYDRETSKTMVEILSGFQS